MEKINGKILIKLTSVFGQGAWFANQKSHYMKIKVKLSSLLTKKLGGNLLGSLRPFVCLRSKDLYLNYSATFKILQ